HPVRPLRRDLDREGLADPVDGRSAARRRRLGQHVQQIRPDQPVRRLQGVRLRPRGRPARPRPLPGGRNHAMSPKTAAPARLSVPKTHKLFIGGKFPRSESGRTYEVTTSRGAFAANVARGSRKDVRDAVRAARSAQPGWAGATGYNRGQVLYRVAELMEGRRSQFEQAVSGGEGLSAARAGAVVSAAIDRWVWYAG